MPFREWTDITTSLDFDAHNTGSITLNGSNVSQWADLSGNNRHAAQATSSLQPAYSATGLNGMPAVVWDGTGDKLVGAWSTTLTARAVFVVFSHSGAGTNTRPFSQWLSGYDDWTTPNYVLPVCRNVGNAEIGIASSAGRSALVPVSWNTPMLFSSIHGSGVITSRLNGGVQTASASVALSTTVSNFILGTNPVSDDARLTGPIAKLVVLDYLPDADTIALIEGVLAWECGIEGSLAADHPYKTFPPSVGGSSSSVLVSGSYGGPSLPIIRNIVDLLYSETNPVRNIVDLVYGIKLAAIIDLLYGNNPVIRQRIVLPYGDAAKLTKMISLLYGDAYQYRQIIDLVWNSREDIRKIIDLRYRINEEEIRKILELRYDLKVYDEWKKIVDLLYGIAPGESLEETTVIDVSTDSGIQLNPFHINVEKEEGKGFDVSLKTYDENDYEACPFGTPVSVTINSDTYLVLVEERDTVREKPKRMFEITLRSQLFLLDAPYALPISEELSGMASSIVRYLVAKEISATVTWSMVDWYIPATVLVASNQTPLELIQNIVTSGGGVVESDKSGNMICRKKYPVNIPDYETVTPGAYLTDQDSFYSVSTQTLKNPGFNNFFISDQTPTADGLSIETRDVSANTKQVLVFQVPWEGDVIRLATSGGNHVQVVNNGVRMETITSELVEIVDGQGKTEHPIYQKVSHSYSETDLGQVTVSEDGTVSTAIKHNSLILITYVTKYHMFTVMDSEIESVQFWPEIL